MRAADWMRLRLTVNMPGPSRKTRDGITAAIPFFVTEAGPVEGTRFWGGQLFAPSRAEWSHYPLWVISPCVQKRPATNRWDGKCSTWNKTEILITPAEGDRRPVDR